MYMCEAQKDGDSLASNEKLKYLLQELVSRIIRTNEVHKNMQEFIAAKPLFLLGLILDQIVSQFDKDVWFLMQKQVNRALGSFHQNVMSRVVVPEPAPQRTFSDKLPPLAK